MVVLKRQPCPQIRTGTRTIADAVKDLQIRDGPGFRLVPHLIADVLITDKQSGWGIVQ